MIGEKEKRLREMREQLAEIHARLERITVSPPVKSVTKVTGRPRVYASNAEKQRAYRQRKAAS